MDKIELIDLLNKNGAISDCYKICEQEQLKIKGEYFTHQLL